MKRKLHNIFNLRKEKMEMHDYNYRTALILINAVPKLLSWQSLFEI